MKDTTLFLAFFSVALIAAPGLVKAADNNADEQQIRQIERDWLDSMIKRDGAYLQKIETDDFTITGPDGRMLNKAENLKDAISGETVFDDVEIERLNVRFYGDTAIVNGLGTVKSHTKSEKMKGEYSWTDVFVKMNGAWKAASAHVTAVADK
jgi:ketosteroid isomerase-like protein